MNRAGTYVSNLSGSAAYRSFRPSPLPPVPPLVLNEDTIRLLVDANRKLSELNTAASLLPCTDLFVSMYVRKEALMTSQIEGTQCTLDDILDPDMDANANLDAVRAIDTLVEHAWRLVSDLDVAITAREMDDDGAIAEDPAA